MWWSKNKFLVFFFTVFFGFQLPSYAQREIDPEAKFSFKDRSYFGGSLGLQLGTVTLIDLSPLAGVMLSPKFSTGLGVTYQYYEDNRFQGAAGSSFGGRGLLYSVWGSWGSQFYFFVQPPSFQSTGLLQ